MSCVYHWLVVSGRFLGLLYLCGAVTTYHPKFISKDSLLSSYFFIPSFSIFSKILLISKFIFNYLIIISCVACYFNLTLLANFRCFRNSSRFDRHFCNNNFDRIALNLLSIFYLCRISVLLQFARNYC